MSSGHTLLELAASLTLAATLVSVASPAYARYRDMAAVSAARETVVAALVEARSRAVGGAGAAVHVATDPAVVRVTVGADTVRTAPLASPHGLRVDLGRRDSLVLPFDDLGLGTFASATLRFSLRGTTRALVVSSYGRVRRR